MKKTLLSILSMFLVVASISAQYYTEDFEGGIPADWTVENEWKIGTSSSHSSQYFKPPEHTMFMCVNDDNLGNGNSGDGRIISGSIDLSGSADDIIVQHQAYFINGDFQGADETAKVLVSTDDGATWDEVSSLPAYGGEWGNARADISSYSGQTIKLAFEYLDGNQWNYGYCVDDIQIVDAPARDISLRYIESYCQATTPGAETSISGMVDNNSIDVINSIDLNWTNGGDSGSETITGLDIQPFQSYYFNQAVTVVVADGQNDIEVSVTSSDVVDTDASNDMASATTLAITPVEGSGIFVEEATGTWCTWCPRGAFYMDRYNDCFPNNFVGVAVHASNGNAIDPMEVGTYRTGMNDFPGFTGYPSVVLERTSLLNPDAIGNPVINKITSAPLALVEVGAEFNDATRTLTVSVTGSDFVNTMNGVKFFAAVTEDDVTGSADGYAQVNSYAGGGNGPMGGYEVLASPVPANQMIHNHVARAMLGDFNGSNATDISSGSGAGYIFSSVVIPADQDLSNMHIAGALFGANGQVINSASVTLVEAIENGLYVSSSNDVYDNNLATIFPNPVADLAYIQLDLDAVSNVTLDVYDILGRKIDNVQYGTVIGNTTLNYSTDKLNNGVYTIHLTVGETLVSKKITIAK